MLISPEVAIDFQSIHQSIWSWYFEFQITTKFHLQFFFIEINFKKILVDLGRLFEAIIQNFDENLKLKSNKTNLIYDADYSTMIPNAYSIGVLNLMYR